MGWWRISGPDGGLSFDVPPSGKPEGSGLLNARPGRDAQEDHYNGDGPADLMGAALNDIAHLYQEEWGRPPFLEELEACFNFVLGPHRDSGKYDPTA